MSQEALQSAESSGPSSLAESSQLLDRYEILDRLGEGGFGVVYKARQRTTGQLVAIKQIRGADTVQTSVHEEMRRRFKREMSLIGNLRNAHVVRLLDAGASGDDLFMVLEFVDGVPLSKMLTRQGALPLDHALRIIEHVLEALAEAHDLGIVHRDLKPDNIMISGTGSRLDAKVLDFGIAGVEQDFRGALDVGHETITKFGQFLGTPSYMAPEQFQLFDDPRVQTDIYAIGLILLECLTGQRAVQGANLMEIAQKQARDPTPIPADVAPSVAGIIDRATRKAPEDRFESADEMLRVVSALRSGTGEAEILAMTAGGHVEASPAPTVNVSPAGRDVAPNATVPVPGMALADAEAPVLAPTIDSDVGQLDALDPPSGELDTINSRSGRARTHALVGGVVVVAAAVAVAMAWPRSEGETTQQTTTATTVAVEQPEVAPPEAAPGPHPFEISVVAAVNGGAGAAATFVEPVVVDAGPSEAERIQAALFAAMTAERVRDFDAAAAHYDEVLALRADHPDALDGKAQLLLKGGAFGDALPLLEALGAHADREGHALYLRGRARAGLGDDDGAAVLYDEYLARFSGESYADDAREELRRIERERKRRDRRNRDGEGDKPDAIQGGPLIPF